MKKEAKEICDMLLYVTLSTFKEKVTFVLRNVLIHTIYTKERADEIQCQQNLQVV